MCDGIRMMLVAAAWVGFWSGGALARGDGADDAMLAEALKAIKFQETSVHSISMEAKSVSHGWDGELNDWILAGENDVKGVFDGSPGGRSAVDVSRELGQMIQGRGVAGDPVLFSAMAYSEAYNGRFGQRFDKTQQIPNEQLVDVSEGYVGRQRPEDLDRLGANVGRTASLFGFSERQLFHKVTLSALLEQPGVQLIAKKTTTADGKTYLLVTRIADDVKFNWGKHEFWLDPEHGYAIARIKEFNGVLVNPKKLSYAVSTDVREETIISDFWQPSPGVFYPKHIDSWTFERGKNGKRPIAYFKSEVDVRSVKVNDPAVNDETYTLVFPKDAVIYVFFPQGAGKTELTTKVNISVWTVKEQAVQLEKILQEGEKNAATRPGNAVEAKP